MEKIVYAYTVHITQTLQVIIFSHNTDKALYELYVTIESQVCNFS